MDLIIKTYKETNILVLWTLDVPRINMKEKSESFLMYGYKWNLEFDVTSGYRGQGEKWTMKLHHSNDKESPKFALMLYIRYEGRYLYLKTLDVQSKDSTIWYTVYSSFRNEFPDIGTSLQFMLDFHLGIPDLQTPIKGLIPEETSDDYPCLKNLSLDLSKLVENGTDTDVQLKCGDFSLGAHKLILGARSEVFRTMMQTDTMKGRDGIVEISGMEPENLNTFIRYFYSGILPEITVDTAIQIYEAAVKYQVESLKNRSSRFLVKHLSQENALKILVIANAHGDLDFKDQIVSYILKEKIPSRKEEWQKFCIDYPKLSIELLNFFYDLPSISR